MKKNKKINPYKNKFIFGSSISCNQYNENQNEKIYFFINQDFQNENNLIFLSEIIFIINSECNEGFINSGN